MNFQITLIPKETKAQRAKVLVLVQRGILTGDKTTEEVPLLLDETGSLLAGDASLFVGDTDALFFGD